MVMIIIFFFFLEEQQLPQLQCLWNYIGTSAFADISNLMADV